MTRKTENVLLLMALALACLAILGFAISSPGALECDYGYIEVTVGNHETQCVAWERVAEFPFTD